MYICRCNFYEYNLKVEFMKVIIVGTGYVGLVTGTCFSDVGIEVCCVDIDAQKIANLKQGISPIYEQGLDELISRNVAKGTLSFSTSLAKSMDEADVIFIAVGTPPDEDGSADLQYVLSVAQEVGANMKKHILVVTKSTVPVGTAQKVREEVQKQLDLRKSDLTFDIVSNPEFLKEGSAIKDFMYPERIIVGVESERAEQIMAKLYKPYTLNGHPIIFMDVPSAEMTKYAANAMLATRISFMNDIANVCELLGANISMVRKGISSDSRIGSHFLYPGVGYGGSCFPKDVKALIKTARKNGYEMRVLQSVEDVNDTQKKLLFNKFKTYHHGDIAGKTIAFWGLAFKPGTDDMREAPSLVLIDLLVAAGCKVNVYDPVSMEECKRRVGDKVQYCEGLYDCVDGADALFLLTEWTEFRFPNWESVKKLVKTPLIFDGRNIFDKAELEQLGFSYFGVGI